MADSTAMKISLTPFCAEQAGIPGKAGTAFETDEYVDDILKNHAEITGEIVEVVEPDSYWVELDCGCKILMLEDLLEDWLTDDHDRIVKEVMGA